MIALYLFKLLCLCLASFFVVNAALELTVRAASRFAIRIAEKMRPRTAARFLFFLGVLPAGVGMAVVMGLCLPSYLWLEPQATAERVGYICLILAGFGTASWCAAGVRTARAVGASLRVSRTWRLERRRDFGLPEVGLSAAVVETDAPVLALAGVSLPYLVISRGVLRVLSNEQLDVALRHEHAHRVSRDNLKRLFLLLIPDIFPFIRRPTLLEQTWARLSEWAADDEAVDGDSHRALSLATALLQVARMGAGPRLSFLHTSLVPSGHDLSARINRLLDDERRPAEANSQNRFFAGHRAVGGLCLAACAMALAVGPAGLSTVHRLLELFLR